MCWCCAFADFGHILGHFKYKMGIKRERSVFVFTPQMAHVLGNVDSGPFKDFVALSCAALNTLRKHGNLLITLFSLMVACGLEELQTDKEIDWMRKTLRCVRGRGRDRERTLPAAAARLPLPLPLLAVSHTHLTCSAAARTSGGAGSA